MSSHHAAGRSVYAAAAAQVGNTAFTIRHSSGFMQVALPARRCDELGLSAQCGADHGDLAQCVTVDAAEGIGTGISAADRATTARLLAAPASTREQFTRPGHLVPLRARPDLSPWDFGMAEAAVHLVSATGAPPAAVLADIVDPVDPRQMAHGQSLRTFAHTQGLPMIGLDDLAVCAPLVPTVDLEVRTETEPAG